MALIPKEHEVKTLLDYEGKDELPRPYLGLSMIGHPCTRYLQYYWRWAFAESVGGRLRRLFDMGHDAEARVLKELGIEETTQRRIEGYAGHWAGHCDGIWRDQVIEIKTHSKSNYAKVMKDGIRAFPKHYAQIQAYMSGDGMPKRGIYIAICKDNSDVYVQSVPIDRGFCEDLERKQRDVITSTRLSHKIGNGQPTWHECRFCSAKQICHYNQKIETNCRTCQDVAVLSEGRWHCDRYDIPLDLDAQKMGCPDYQLDADYF